MSAATVYTVHAGPLTYGKHPSLAPALTAAHKLAASLPAWVSVTVWRGGRQVYPVTR